MRDKKKEFIDYLENSASLMLEEEKKLVLDERKDEANLVKIKTNIFNIFNTIFHVIIKNESLDNENIRLLFEEKMESIPQNWKTSYENAKAHNDVEKIAMIYGGKIL